MYNQRVLQAIASLTHKPSYLVLDKGMSETEVSCIMVIQGSFFGMGYLPKNVEDLRYEAIAPYIQQYKENSYIRSLLLSHAASNPTQVKHITTNTQYTSDEQALEQAF
jgi:DNA polymerase-3 subunit epsilon